MPAIGPGPSSEPCRITRECHGEDRRPRGSHRTRAILRTLQSALPPLQRGQSDCVQEGVPSTCLSTQQTSIQGWEVASTPALLPCVDMVRTLWSMDRGGWEQGELCGHRLVGAGGGLWTEVGHILQMSKAEMPPVSGRVLLKVAALAPPQLESRDMNCGLWLLKGLLPADPWWQLGQQSLRFPLGPVVCQSPFSLSVASQPHSRFT